MESPEVPQAEDSVIAIPGILSEDEDDMVICSSHDLERRQSMEKDGFCVEVLSFIPIDGIQSDCDAHGLDDTPSNLSKEAVLDNSQDFEVSPDKECLVEGKSIEDRSNKIKNSSDATNSADSPKTSELDLTDENSNTQLCTDKSAKLTQTQRTDSVYDRVTETDAQIFYPVEKSAVESDKVSCHETNVSTIMCKQTEIVNLNSSVLAEKDDSSKTGSSEATNNSITVEMKMPQFIKQMNPGVEVNDAAVIAASWIESLVDLEDKDAVIGKLKDHVTCLTSLLKHKDETLKFIEEQTKTEVDKMSSEITLLRLTLVKEQKKVMKLEEDLKKRDDVIKKFKSSFERIGKAVTIEQTAETNSKSDEDMLKTLCIVKDSLPGVSPVKEPEVFPHIPPPAAHGTLSPYASSVPMSPSQASHTPKHRLVMHPNPTLTSPRMGALGNTPVNMMNSGPINPQFRLPFMGRTAPVNGLHPNVGHMTPRPAHQKQKTSLPGDIKSFGEAVSLCVQKHMSGSSIMNRGAHYGPNLPHGIPLTHGTHIPPSGLPHGNQPSLPFPASAQHHLSPNHQNPNLSAQYQSPPAMPATSENTDSSSPKPEKKRSRRKNPNPVSTKRSKMEFYKTFEIPDTPPEQVTEPSVLITNIPQDISDADEHDEPYVIPEELRALTPIDHMKEEFLEDSLQLPNTPSLCVFPELSMKTEPSFTNVNENSNNSPMIVNVASLAAKAKEFKLRRESFESGSDAYSPRGNLSMHSEDSEYETYANKPRHKCTFCEPSTSFSYCNDLLMHLYNQHKHVTCDEIQSYLLGTVDVLTKQLLTDNNEFYNIAAENQKGKNKGSICRICVRRLPSRYMFVLHMCTHTGEKPYKCEFCSKRFVDGVTLWKHKKLHADEHPELVTPKAELHGKPYHCDECGKGFLHQGSLSNHRKLHIGWKPYKCEGCGKEFTRNASLMIHMRSHTKETPFKCQLCGKGFTQSCNLNTHLRIHRGEKPFHCNICNKNFSRKFVLQKHRCIVGASSDRSTTVSMISA